RELAEALRHAGIPAETRTIPRRAGVGIFRRTKSTSVEAWFVGRRRRTRELDAWHGDAADTYLLADGSSLSVGSWSSYEQYPAEREFSADEIRDLRAFVHG